MKKLKWAAFAMIVLGAILLAYGAVIGEGRIIILLFIPVYEGSGAWALGGGLFIFLGIVLGMIYLFKTYFPPPYEAQPGSSSGAPGQQSMAPQGGPRQGGVIFLGPVPIVWGSDAKTTLYTIIIGVIVVVIVLVSIFFFVIYNSVLR